LLVFSLLMFPLLMFPLLMFPLLMLPLLMLDHVAGEPSDRGRHRGDGPGFPLAHGCGEVLVAGDGRQDAVDDDMLAGDPDLAELTIGAVDLGQGRGLRPGHQDQPGHGRVLQRAHGPGIHRALLLQPGQRAETGGIALAGFQEVGPRAR